MELLGHHMCPTFPPVPNDVPELSSFDDIQIIIIGAGVAGLSAAATLRKMGLTQPGQVTILEASSCVGGRLKATTSDAFNNTDTEELPPLDLGAEWIHSVKGAQVLQSIMEDLTPPPDPAVVNPDLISYQPTVCFNNQKSRLASCLYQETKFRRTTWYHWLIANLYDSLPKDCVVLDAPVVKVAYDDDNTCEQNKNGRVTLTLKDGTIRTATKVICTAPLALLQEPAGIEFDPPLPKAMSDAMDAIDMPPGVRVLFQMKEKFYEDVNYCGAMWEAMRNGDDLAAIYDPLYGKGLTDQHHVCAFVAIGHKNAGELCDLTDDDLSKSVLARMDEMYQGKASQNLIGTPIVQNWKAEPYIRGAYTFPAPSKLRRQLGNPIGKMGGAVFLAGEHTSPTHASLVPGAACEGRRAALAVVASLKLI